MSSTLSRRSFLRSSIAAAAVGTAGAWSLQEPAMAAAGAAPLLPYTGDSYFRSTVGALSVDSTRTAAFRSFMKTHPDQKKFAYPRINGAASGNSWGTTFHLGSASDPVWKLKNPRTETKILATQGFHMADAVAARVPTGTQDRPLLVVDPVLGYSIFCADVVPDRATRTITVSNSAVDYHASNGLDGRNPRSNDKRNFNSRGRIPDALVIRPDLLSYGMANGTGLGHVLQAFFVETRSADGFRHPMVGAENSKVGFGAEGERLAISPSVDLTKRGLSPAGLVLARTLQQHGMYLGDNSGSFTKLKGAQSTSTYDPYGGALNADSLKRITWDDFVVLER